ncbi:hypothetical protein D3C87_1905940 [compost metagenome]
MLSFVILSSSIFGFAGLILSPILLILLKELLQQGYLQRWIFLPKEEFIVSPFAASGEPSTPGGEAVSGDSDGTHAPEDSASRSNT